jgi:hypothetical protein
LFQSALANLPLTVISLMRSSSEVIPATVDS